MPAPTDLTWAQLQAAFAELGIQSVLSETVVGAVYHVNFNVSPIVGEVGMVGGGVVKFATKLLEACRLAQDRLNTDASGALKPAGERFDAFPAPTLAPAIGAFVPVTRSVRSRSDIGSATKVVGATA